MNSIILVIFIIIIIIIIIIITSSICHFHVIFLASFSLWVPSLGRTGYISTWFPQNVTFPFLCWFLHSLKLQVSPHPSSCNDIREVSILLPEVLTFINEPVVAFHVLHPYNRPAFTLGLMSWRAWTVADIWQCVSIH